MVLASSKMRMTAIATPGATKLEPFRMVLPGLARRSFVAGYTVSIVK